MWQGSQQTTLGLQKLPKSRLPSAQIQTHSLPSLFKQHACSEQHMSAVPLVWIQLHLVECKSIQTLATQTYLNTCRLHLITLHI